MITPIQAHSEIAAMTSLVSVHREVRLGRICDGRT